MSVTVFSAAYLDSLVDEAVASPRLRQHRNIHVDYADPCQRLFNAIEPSSYIRPHRHSRGPGPETMMAVRGLMALFVFDDEGGVTQVQRFGAGLHVGADGVAAGVEVPTGCWHTVVALEPGSVLLEVKAGPFDPAASKEPALWAPEEGGDAAAGYLLVLHEKVTRRGGV